MVRPEVLRIVEGESARLNAVEMLIDTIVNYGDSLMVVGRAGKLPLRMRLCRAGAGPRRGRGDPGRLGSRAGASHCSILTNRERVHPAATGRRRGRGTIRGCRCRSSSRSQRCRRCRSTSTCRRCPALYRRLDRSEDCLFRPHLLSRWPGGRPTRVRSPLGPFRPTAPPAHRARALLRRISPLRRRLRHRDFSRRPGAAGNRRLLRARARAGDGP